nr:AI-2E family transporter [Pararhodobacter sp. SW119]
MPVATQLRYWGLAAVALVLVLWFLGDILLPFVLGATLAYLLNPLVDRLVRLGIGRVLAAVLIALASLAAFALALVLIVPVVVEQGAALWREAPGVLNSVQQALGRYMPETFSEGARLENAVAGLGEWLQARGGEVAERLLTSARSILSVLMLIVVVPVVAFYLLVDWHRMLGRIDALLPREHAPTIRQLGREVDDAVSGFLRGMGSVCLIMAVYYAVALSLAGLQFGVVVGVLTGILTFIPYLGAIIGGALAFGLALYQFWGDWFSILLVAGVFVAGQAVEGNYITPRIVGRSVGLHPVWILAALSAFGSLFGFLGLLVAVPLAAALAVLVRHAIGLYKQSDLYAGPVARPGPSETPARPGSRVIVDDPNADAP